MLAFLAAVLVLMALDYPVGTFTVGSLVVIIPLLVVGWYVWRRDITRIAAERAGHVVRLPTVPGEEPECGRDL